MIEHLLHPLVCERFKSDARYREGHLRVVNALPERRVLGLHSPEIKPLQSNFLLMAARSFVPSNRCRTIAFVTRRPSSGVI